MIDVPIVCAIVTVMDHVVDDPEWSEPPFSCFLSLEEDPDQPVWKLSPGKPSCADAC